METVTEKSEKLNDRAMNSTKRAIQQFKYKIQAILTRLRLPSPTSHLLCSNEPPTETEHALILYTISQAQAKADRLLVELTSDSRMLVLARQLAQVNLKKVNKTLVEHRNILSPIRRIPVEILEAIFAFSISDCEYREIGSDHFYRKSYSIPRSQSQVCRFWRGVALSNPRLWTHIPTISLGRPYSRKPTFLAFLTDLLDQRCGNAPINFHIVCCPKSDDFSSHPAVTVLVSHCAKWKTAIMYDLSWSEALSRFSQIKGCIPLLETLVLSFGPFRYDESLMRVDVFQLAPQLHEVVILRHPPVFLLPYHQLLHYHNAHAMMHGFEYVSQFPLLRTLELGMVYLTGVGGPVMGFINLTMLKLRIASNPDGQLHDIQRLVLPALKDLSISFQLFAIRQPDGVSVMSSIINMLIRSGIPSLERLHLHTHSRDEAGVLTSLLRHVPLLTHLQIDLPHAEDLIELAQTIDVVAPFLQVCAFYSDGPLDHYMGNLLHQLALNRCEVLDHKGPIHRLRALYIVNHHYHGLSDLESQKRILQGWTENTVNVVDVYLKAYRESLDSHLYNKPRQPVNYNGLTHPGKDYSSVVFSTLSLIEQMEVTQAKDLYVSGIFQLVHRMANSDWKPIIKYNEPLIRILKKWKPLMESSFDDIHWAIHSHDRRLFYVPSDSLFRRSFDDMIRLVLDRLDHDVPEVDCPWPPNTGDRYFEDI